MKINIPDKMQDIIDKHKFDISNYSLKDNKAIITLKYVFYYGYVYKIKIISDNTIDAFIKALDAYYENTDFNPYDLADEIWDSGCDYNDWNDLFGDTEEYWHNLSLFRIDLWENCPRLDEHGNYLKLVEN